MTLGSSLRVIGGVKELVGFSFPPGSKFELDLEAKISQRKG